VFGRDAEIRAGLSPQETAVAAAVVGQDPLHSHAAVGEPGDRVAKHRGRCLLGLVVVDLGIGDPGVVIDHGVDERGPELGFAGGGLQPRPVPGRLPVREALLATQISPATAVGDVAELLDVDVDEVAGALMLVAANRFASGSVDM
jgi:hypothetical protein